MRNKTALGALIIFAALAGVGIAQADDDAKTPSKGNWFTRLFVSDKKEADAKKAEPKKDPGPSLQEIHAKAKEDLLRRQLICLRLLEIANETGDDDLRRKAKQLDDRAFEIYKDKTGANLRVNLTSTEKTDISGSRAGPTAAPLGRANNDRSKTREAQP